MDIFFLLLVGGQTVGRRPVKSPSLGISKIQPEQDNKLFDLPSRMALLRERGYTM